MKAKNIMDALGGISDDLIEAAENSTPAKRLRLPRWAAFVASLALVIAAAAVIVPRVSPDRETNEAAKNRYKEGTNVITTKGARVFIHKSKSPCLILLAASQWSWA